MRQAIMQELNDQTPVAAEMIEPTSIRQRRKRLTFIALFVLLVVVGAVVGVVVALSGGDDSSPDTVAAPGLQPSTPPTTGNPITTSPSTAPSFSPTYNPVTQTEIVYFVNSLTLSGKIIFYPIPTSGSDTTPEDRALEWLIEEDQTDYSNQGNREKLEQRYALAVVFYSTTGSSWLDSTDWLLAANECTWFGVACDLDQKVTTLTLESNNLDGILPADIGLLDSLLSMDFHSNPKLGGSLPNSLGTSASSVTL